MSPLLRKELRMLLPAWAVALLLATMPVWPWRVFPPFLEFSFGAAVVLLGLTPFGQEMSGGTFGLLLVQPDKRARFWRIKAGLLALALLSVWGLFAVCWFYACHYLHPEFAPFLGTPGIMAEITGLVALLAFSGGLWSTLLLREVTTAFFASVLVPVAIYGAADAWMGGNQVWGDVVVALALAIYACAGVLLAWRLFLNAQDTGWTGGRLSVGSVLRGPYRGLALGFQKKRGPFFALFCKELQLQEVTMVLVPLLFIFHLVALAARHFAPIWSLHQVALNATPFLWTLTVPLVVGCVAVAEERRCNTLESQLCLPVRQYGQFAVKVVVVMVLAMVFGAFVPWGLENLGLCKTDFAGLRYLNMFLAIAAIVAGISFFASTMTRGMLQAFAVGLLSFILLGIPCLTFLDGQGRDARPFFPVIVWPAMIVAYFWLAFRNYQRLQTDSRLWAGNLLGLAAAFIAAVGFSDCIRDLI